ncbi:MAG: ABC transporter permease [Gemmataceae bacterium]
MNDVAVRQSGFIASLIPRPSTLRKYFRIFRASLTERFAYRGDFFLSTFLRFLPMLTTILLWTAVFEGAKAAGRTELGGYTYEDTISYLLLVHITRMFSSMPGLPGGIARDIRDGTLKKYLVQPLDLLGYLISYRVAHKVAYIATSILPYGVLFAMCHSFFQHLPDLPTFLGYLASLLLAFCVGFFFESCIGMIGFWMLEVSSILYVIMTLSYFVSGQMFPLALLPGFWPSLLKSLPTYYAAGFSADVFIGKVSGPDLVRGLALEAAWAIGLMFLARLLYRVGLRRYSAYGG